MKLDLQGILDPFEKETFFNDYLETNPLYVKRNDIAYFSDFLDLEKINRLIGDAISLNSPYLKLVSPSGIVASSQYRSYSQFQNVEIGTAIISENVWGIFDKGAAAITLQNKGSAFNAAQELARSVATELHCGTTSSIKIYPPELTPFKARYESHDVLVLQLHGVQTLKLFEDKIDLPLRAHKDNCVTDNWEGQFQLIQLSAGDTLYVPRGTVFQEGSNRDISASFLLDVHLTTYTKLFLQLIQQLGEDESVFRRDYFFDHLRNAPSAQNQVKEIRRLVERKFTLENMDKIFSKDVSKRI